MHVLLVEDEPAIADAVTYALESESISCEWACTGEDALNKLQVCDPQLVLLDIGLPDTNGFDLFKRIKQASSASVIFLTSRSSEIDQVLGLELGADDYITKPFSPRVLSARVRLHLRHRQQNDGHLAQTNMPPQLFVVDNDAKRISVKGQALDLSRYEFGLLALFLSHPTKIFSRDQLMQQVWNAPEESFDRTVDTHIKVLRQKLKVVLPNASVIKTHRGSGYSFEPSSI